MENTVPSLAAVWATVAGNCFQLHHFSALKLLDAAYPVSPRQNTPGCSFALPAPAEVKEAAEMIAGS